MKRAAILALFASGCAMGGSSSVVGRWRARRIVDSTACVQLQARGDGCAKHITIGRDIPARRFSGMLISWANPGYMQQRGNGSVGHGLAVDSYLEYYRGRGRYALAMRVGGNLASGFDDRLYLTVPVSVVGHVGGLWGSVYLGAGYAPIASATQYTGEGEMREASPSVYHHDSVHAFVGTRFWLTRTLERGLSLSPELRIQTFDDSVLSSLTFNVGLHL